MKRANKRQVKMCMSSTHNFERRFATVIPDILAARGEEGESCHEPPEFLQHPGPSSRDDDGEIVLGGPPQDALSFRRTGHESRRNTTALCVLGEKFVWCGGAVRLALVAWAMYTWGSRDHSCLQSGWIVE